MAAQTKIQFRRGPIIDWVSVNPILSAGEVGYETDSRKFKIGDGTTAWNSLPYAAVLPSELNELVDDRVNDLLITGSNLVKTYNDENNTLTISVSGVSLIGHTHTSSEITDFNNSVSGLLPVKSIIAGTNIAVTPTGDAGFIVSTVGVDENTVKDIIGSSITGVSGVAVSYNNTSKITTVSLSDPSIQSTDITDFNTAVSGLVDGIYAPLNSPSLTGTPTTPTAAADTNSSQIASTAFVLNQASSSSPLMDGIATIGTSSRYARADHVHPTDTTRAALAGATFTGAVSIPSGTGNFNSLTVNNTSVSLNGHTHIASDITNFNTAVSGLIGVKSLVQGSGIGISNVGGAHTISITGIPSTLITDLGNIATTEVIGRTGILLSYNAVTDTMYIDVTGVSLVGHTHVWNDITDASTKATLSELTYLSGVIAGTASAGRALVTDSNKDLSGINNLITAGNVTVGGDLIVQGTTTTVNSTTVNIGDNIIRVNTSGLSTGGLEVYDGVTVKDIVWNSITNRWEFSGGNVYTSGYFIGNVSGNASTVTNGVYTTDTGTVTSTMIADNTIVDADINSAASISYSKLNLNNSITNNDISTTGSISYSKLNLSSSIINADISSSAAIDVTKLASSGITFGSTVANLGNTILSFVGLNSISGTSLSSPTVLYNCLIDGGTP